MIGKDLDALFPDSFEESEQGLIPKGWKSALYSFALLFLLNRD